MVGRGSPKSQSADKGHKFNILILQQIVSTSFYEQKPKSMKETRNQKSLKF